MSTSPVEDIPFPAGDTAPLERIMYISLPDDMDRDIEGFQIDTSIPLPVEPPAGVDPTQLENLSWEMIVAAMLKLFAYQPDHPHIEYFRDFIAVVQANIVNEMTQTGILKAQNGDYEIAEELFRSLVNYAPQHESTFINLALSFEQHGNFLKEQGNTAEMERYYELALSAYSRGSRYHPDSANLHFSAGHFFLQLNNVAKTKEHFSKYLELEQEDSEKRRQVKKALEQLDAKTESDHLFAEAFDFIKMGQEERGIQKIKEFLEKDPSVWNGWFLLGWGLRKKAQYLEAAEAFQKSLELNESNPDTYNELAICNLELQQYAKARQNLEEALKLEPENTKVISNLGILALKQGDLEQAKRFFLTVQELDPDDPIAEQYLEKIDGQT